MRGWYGGRHCNLHCLRSRGWSQYRGLYYLRGYTWGRHSDLYCLRSRGWRRGNLYCPGGWGHGWWENWRAGRRQFGWIWGWAGGRACARCGVACQAGQAGCGQPLWPTKVQSERCVWAVACRADCAGQPVQGVARTSLQRIVGPRADVAQGARGVTGPDRRAGARGPGLRGAWATWGARWGVGTGLAAWAGILGVAAPG